MNILSMLSQLFGGMGGGSCASGAAQTFSAATGSGGLGNLFSMICSLFGLGC